MLQRTLRTVSALLLSTAALASLQPLQAQTTMRTTRVAAGLSNPLFVTAPVGDTSRAFIVEQRSGNIGRIRILDLTQNPPVLLATPYLSISPVATSDEEGLLGLAFHPDFANNGYFFVYYTNSSGNNQVVRYQANAPFATSTTADASSALQVIPFSHPTNSNHNGGWIAFGPDGYLYIDTGDGGAGNDPPGNAQNINSYLGKMHRLDINGDDFPGDTTRNYAIPPTNPFAGATPGLDEIWLYGLRNPWRSSFDRLTGDLWIGDVGQGAIEEVDVIPAGQGGKNMGWRCQEGNNCTGLSGCTCFSTALTPPVHTYPHTGGNCSITGGYRYRGNAMCSFQGLYFFADYCTARIWTVEWNGTAIQNLTERTGQLAPGGGLAINQLTSFGEDASGEIYICDRGGEVFKIIPGTIVDCNGNGLHDGCDISNGTSHDWNGNGVLDECEPTQGTASCFGDGTTPLACPCANSGAVGRGCDNSALTGGARLEGAGDPGSDQVVLISTGELSSVLTIFLQGDVANNNGITFGDGVRCASGTLKRLYSHNASSGIAHAPNAIEPSITTQSTNLGDPLFPLSGQVRYYQAYYRDPDLSFCAAPQGNTWNVSSMFTITW